MNVGTNSPTFTIPSVTAADAGGYRVIVANSAGSVVSDAVVLAVNPGPVATLAPGLEAEFFDFTDPAQGDAETSRAGSPT